MEKKKKKVESNEDRFESAVSAVSFCTWSSYKPRILKVLTLQSEADPFPPVTQGLLWILGKDVYLLHPKHNKVLFNWTGVFSSVVLFL